MPNGNNKKNRRDRSLNEKRLDKVADRTISNQKTAKALNSFAKSTKKTPMPTGVLPHPHAMLTVEEAKYHERMRGGEGHPDILINDNIESSLHSQRYRTDYERRLTVEGNGAAQITIMAATNSDPGADTPKAFATVPLAHVGGAANYGYAGPCSNLDGSIKSAAVLLNNMPVTGMNLRTNSSGTFMDIVDPTRPCPFTVPGDRSGSQLRWQLVKIQIRVINRTIGANRGGLCYIIQPTNRPTDLADVGPQPIEFAQRGIFKVFEDCETTGPSTSDGWVTLSVRDGLNAYHANDVGSSNSLVGGAAYVVMEPPSSDQDIVVMTKLYWSLAGSAVRGIARPHVVSREQSDRAATANSVMRNANIIPSEQKGKEHIPAAIALNDSPALQAIVTPRATSLAKLGGVLHPAVKAFKHFAGRHLRTLADAGVAGLAKIAMTKI